MIYRKQMNNSFKKSFFKTAGGPGSGCMEDNTAAIDFLEISPVVTIGKRKQFMSTRAPVLESEQVPTKLIKYKGQEKYVPKKLKNFVDAIRAGEKWPFEKPVKLLRDAEGDYHIIDGHHRALAALITKRPRIKADIYTDNVERKAVNTMNKSANKKEDKEKSDEERIFKPEDEDKGGKARHIYMYGYHQPTANLDTDRRTDLVDQEKPGRPAAF